MYVYVFLKYLFVCFFIRNTTQIFFNFIYVIIAHKKKTKNFYLFYVVTLPPPKNPCDPSPCGPYSQCREINNHAVCTCNIDYIGTPPMCRPECVVSSECIQNRACVNQKCIDPCPGTCGSNARCQVVNHNAICSCSAGYTGDPFLNCYKIECKHVIWVLFLFLNVIGRKKIIFHL